MRVGRVRRDKARAAVVKAKAELVDLEAFLDQEQKALRLTYEEMKGLVVPVLNLVMDEDDEDDEDIDEDDEDEDCDDECDDCSNESCGMHPSVARGPGDR